MDNPTGFDCKLYYLTTGTRATWDGTPSNGIATGAAPSNLSEITIAKDVTINITAGEAEYMNRKSRWKGYRATTLEASVEFNITAEPTDTGYIAIRTAFLTRGTIACAVLDGDKATNGSEGLWADFEVFDFTHDQPLEDGSEVSIVLQPRPSAVAPEWVVVGT